MSALKAALLVGAPQLRLYISRSTPNSVRAEQNLNDVLTAFGDKGIELVPEVIDVFTNAKRAIVDGVIATPTLLVVHGDQRHTLVGDLSDGSHLRSILAGLGVAPSSGVADPAGG